MLLRLLHEVIPSAYKISLSEGSYSMLEMSIACVDKEIYFGKDDDPES